MIATAETGHKICTQCRRRLPIADFRLVRSNSAQRRACCRTCRRDGDRENQNKQDSREVRQSLTEVRHCDSADAILAVVEETSARVGGIHAFVETWIELVKSDEITPSARLRAMNTLIHMLSVADLANIAKEESRPRSAESVIDELNRAGQLIPVLREMFERGSITFDMIDPPAAYDR